MNEKFPRLTQTLPGVRKLGVCQCCSRSSEEVKLELWQECDDHDQPQKIFLQLCESCNESKDEYGKEKRKGTKKDLIQRHPRLYHSVTKHAWIPGLMHLCVNCVHASNFDCTHPLRGQKILSITGPQPISYHLSAGRGRSGWYTQYAPAKSCTGQELKQ